MVDGGLDGIHTARGGQIVPQFVDKSLQNETVVLGILQNVDIQIP